MFSLIKSRKMKLLDTVICSFVFLLTIPNIIAKLVDSKNAPMVCYEEINGQRDRFGHCGFENRHRYRPCAWRYAGEGALALLKCMFNWDWTVKRSVKTPVYGEICEAINSSVCVLLVMVSLLTSQILPWTSQSC